MICDVSVLKESSKERLTPLVASVSAALTKGQEAEAESLIQEIHSFKEKGLAYLVKFRFLKAERRIDEALEFLLNQFESGELVEAPVQLFFEWIDLLALRRDFVLEEKVVATAKLYYPKDLSIFLRQIRSGLREGLSEEFLSVFFVWLEVKPSAKHLSTLFSIFKVIHGHDSDVAYHLIGLLKKHTVSLFLYYSHLAKEAEKRADKEKAIELYELCLAEPTLEKDKEKILKDYLTLRSEGDVSEQALEALRWSFLVPHGEGKPSDTYKVAAITNVYNEKFNLPVWLKHYGEQVGIENCIVLDHGSDDGSTLDLQGAGFIRLPRGKEYNEKSRMELINNLANSLLGYYDAVIYTDCDEMLVADPEKYANLKEYAYRLNRPVAYAIGLNVRHDVSVEPDLVVGQPVLPQRKFVQFVSPMCKPLIIKKPVSWGGGFHASQYKPQFDDLYLFHLRHVDLQLALGRLSVTREVKFAREGGGKHHRREDEELIAFFERIAACEVRDGFDLKGELESHLNGIQLFPSGRYAVFQRNNSNCLYVIPDRLKVF